MIWADTAITLFELRHNDCLHVPSVDKREQPLQFGRVKDLADSPPSMIISASSALWIVAIARIFDFCASSDTPCSA